MYYLNWAEYGKDNVLNKGKYKAVTLWAPLLASFVIAIHSHLYDSEST